MALINCPDCMNKMSDMASFCTSCGYQRAQKKTGLFAALTWLGLGAFFFAPKNLLILIILFTTSTTLISFSRREEFSWLSLIPIGIFLLIFLEIIRIH